MTSSLTRALAAALLAAGSAVVVSRPLPAEADDAARGQGVTYDVATRTERALPPSTSRALDRARAGKLPAGVRVRPEHPPGPSKVFGADDRYPIDETDAYPWSAVAKVWAHFPDGSVAEGSAILVDSRFALTAAHVVHDDDLGGWAHTIEVVPGFDRGAEPFGTWYAADVTTFRGWTQYRDEDYDVALVELDGRAGDETGWMGLGSYSDAFLEGSTVNTAGYPSDLEDGRGMWAATGTLERVDAAQLHFRGTLDAASGQSGSGVWMLLDDGRYVTGVLASETSTWNRAVRITDEIFDSLDRWMGGSGGPASLVLVGFESGLPREALPGDTGTVRVTAANDGGSEASVPIVVTLEAWDGRRIEVGRRNVVLPPGDQQAFDFGVRIPSGAVPATYALVAEIDPEGTVEDEYPGDDWRKWGNVLVLPPAATLVPDASELDTLAPGGLSRYRFDVPAGARKLRVRLRGWRKGTIHATRPDGQGYVFRARSRGLAELDPQTGPWEVVVQNPMTAGRTRTYRLVVKVR